MAWTYHNKPPMGWPLDLREPINDDLAAYWYMPEGSGNIIQDLSGNNNMGIFSGNPIWVPGKSGLCPSFDGTGDYAGLTGVTATPPHTISMWVKPTSPQVNTHSYMLDIQLGRIILACKESGDEVLKYFDGTAWRDTGQDIVDNNWHHIFTETPISGNATIYIDNIPFSFFIANHNNIGGTIKLAHRYAESGSNEWFTGLIDNVSIYDRILSPTERNLIHHFPFYGFLNPDEIPVLDQYYTVAVGGAAGIMTTNTGYWGW